jgi:nicotinate phosphoribosyltransferase
MNHDGMLLTDLYQLTMLQAYHAQSMNGSAVFEFFVRKLPPERNFLLAAGLEQVLDFLEAARFSEEELAWLRDSGRFSAEFVASLADWHFSGEVDAMEEGTLFFADEPILRVVAPIREAQVVESRIINLLQFQSMVASKAVRCVLAAQGRQLVDFGLRRAHGAEAGLLSARAAYLAGFDGSATVAAGVRWGIPLYGTMAHSYVLAHGSEVDAFEHFARACPAGTTLLIDTFDTEAAAHAVVGLARRLAAEGIAIGAVRLDSGDLAEHARRVRHIFDEGGQGAIKIFASGNLDEHRIHELLSHGAPIDGFGVGTRMNTSADHPFLDCAYKLQEYDGRARRKRSEGKATWPGRKQVHRAHNGHGLMSEDTLSLLGEAESGQPLLHPVMREGRRISAPPELSRLRSHVARQLAHLPEVLRALEPGPAFPVEVSGGIRALAMQLDRQAAKAI